MLPYYKVILKFVNKEANEFSFDDTIYIPKIGRTTETVIEHCKKYTNSMLISYRLFGKKEVVVKRN